MNNEGRKGRREERRAHVHAPVLTPGVLDDPVGHLLTEAMKEPLIRENTINMKDLTW